MMCLAAALAAAFAMFGCAQQGTGSQTGKTDTVPIPDNAGVPEPKAETYTVPLRHEKDGTVQWEYTYGADGLSLSKTDYTEETPITYTVTFDENGVPVCMEWTVIVNDTRTEKWRDDYYLDENGRIIEEKRYCEGEIQNAYAYTYDEEGRIGTQTTRDVKQQNIIYRLLYDEMGTHVGTRYKKYNGEAGYYTEMKTCTYDGEGRIIKEETTSYTTEYEYTLTGDLITQKKVTNTAGDYSWSYYYQYTYENGNMVREDCSFGGALTDSAFYCETEFEHYSNAINWIFRERLP